MARKEGPNENHFEGADGEYRKLDLSNRADQEGFISAASKNPELLDDIWSSESSNVGRETPGIGGLLTNAGQKAAYDHPITQGILFVAESVTTGMAVKAAFNITKMLKAGYRVSGLLDSFSSNGLAVLEFS